MDRAQKAESIETLKGVFASAGAVVVAHYSGLTVAEMTDLRSKLRKEGATLKVVKNTLVRKALDGANGEAGDALFTGPVAIAFAPDPVSAAKVAVDYAKTNEKFIVQGGVMGSVVLDAKAVGASGHPAVAGPDPRPAHRPHPGSGHEDRGRAAGSGRPARAGLQRLRHEGRRVSAPSGHLRTHSSNPRIPKEEPHGRPFQDRRRPVRADGPRSR